MHQIIHLPREQWKDAILPMRYTTNEYYEVNLQSTPGRFFRRFPADAH